MPWPISAYLLPNILLVYHGNHDFDAKILETLKNIFQSHYDSNPSKKPNQCDDKGHASCHPEFMMVAAMLHLPPIHHHNVLMTNLTIFLALVNTMTPDCHILATPVASAKTPVQSNGLIVRCTIW